MKTEDILKLAVFAGIAYLLYQTLGKGITALGTATGSAIANFYLWATLPPNMIVNGNVVMPDGSLVALAATDVRQNGNTVVAEYLGHYYQLSPSDANGNWPATLIQ